MQGNIFVISAPSGAGKSSLVKALCQKDNNIQVSISHTTRNIRLGEKNSIDYFFIDENEFLAMINSGDFLEYAQVYDNYYGTSLRSIQRLLEQGLDVILEIDCQGAQSIKKIMPKATMIYILPPSIDELKKRLIQRNTDSLEIIEKRLSHALIEASNVHLFDYLIINNAFTTALNDLYSIILVTRMHTSCVLQNFNFK